MCYRPTELDALVFGHLFTILTTRLTSTELAERIKSHSNLLSFCRRIEQTYFEDKSSWRMGEKTLCSQTFSFSLSFPWRSTEKLEPVSIFTSLHLCLYSVACCLEPKWSTCGSPSEETVPLQPKTSWTWRSVGHITFVFMRKTTLNIFFKRTMGMLISLVCCCFIVLIISA